MAAVARTTRRRSSFCARFLLILEMYSEREHEYRIQALSWNVFSDIYGRDYHSVDVHISCVWRVVLDVICRVT